MHVVNSWPDNIDAVRANATGFKHARNFDEVIRTYISDELEGRKPAA